LKKRIALIASLILVVSSCIEDCRTCVVETTLEPVNFHSTDYPKKTMRLFRVCGADYRYYNNRTEIDTLRNENRKTLKTIKITCPD
jgi:hypothetical protein